MTRIALQVNEVDYDLDVPDGMPLLWILRDLLGLTGTKYGCGLGKCGACTVHVDGKAVRSCQVSGVEVMERSVITIEGLSTNGEHPVQIAWKEFNVPQCGYCQPAQMMQAAALLGQSGISCSNRVIDREMSKILCRCGTYPRIRRAIASLVNLNREE
ncbi:MAG: (2Fe-2S)-binding protein [Saprospiraceae bacterium]|nr:(2Fe-2S)-binding protein [Saprospiraceae bacterium]